MLEKLRLAIEDGNIEEVYKEVFVTRDKLSTSVLSPIMLEQLTDIIYACEEDDWEEAIDLLEVLEVDINN